MDSNIKEVDVHLPARQKASLKKQALGLDMSLSEYARLVVLLDKLQLVSENLKLKLVAKNFNAKNTARIRFRVAEHVYEHVSRQAEKYGMSVSSYLRALLSVPVMPGSGEDAIVVVNTKEFKDQISAIRGDLGRIGNNVNQIAYGLNVLQKQRAFPTDYVRELFTACERRLADCDDHLAQLSEQILVVIELLVSLDSEHVPFVNGGADIREGRLDLDQEKMN